MSEERDCDYCGREHFGSGPYCSTRCKEMAADDDRAASFPPQDSGSERVDWSPAGQQGVRTGRSFGVASFF